MSKTKKILILGLSQAGKTTFYRKLIKKYALNQVPAPKTSALVNYTEQFVKFKNNYYSLIDTPAFILHPRNEIERAKQKQIEKLIKESALIFWVVDLSKPINQNTENLNQYLRQFFISQILILSKADLVEHPEYQISLFQKLGRNYLYPFLTSEPLSEELMEKVVNLVPASPVLPEIDKKAQLKLVIFGPPNSGKSTLLNYLLRQNRSLVSPTAGTTQEPVKDY
jgi:GTPase